MRRHPYLFIANDSTDAGLLTAMCALARSRNVGVKVGMEAFYSLGAQGIAETLARASDNAGKALPLFLDLKLHDIPNTVNKGLGALASVLSPQVMTVHASGGRAMLAAAAAHQRDAQGEQGEQGEQTTQAGRLDIAGVTLLTSLADQDLRLFGQATAQQKVAEMAGLVAASGCRALVCSGHEVAHVKASLPALWTIVPGIRLAQDAPGDQRRVMTPARAVEAGADSLVVGRSISGARDPERALDLVLAEIAQAQAGRQGDAG